MLYTGAFPKTCVQNCSRDETMGDENLSELTDRAQPAPLRADVSELRLQSISRVGDLHPGAAVSLVLLQILSAWVAADILFVVIAAAGNAVLLSLLHCRRTPHRVYGAVLLAIGWAVAMRAGLSCKFNGDWITLLSCARRPGRGLVAACMAAFSVLVLSAALRKDRMARTMLQVGVNRQLLWAIFMIPTFGQALLHASKKSSLLMQGRYLQSTAPVRWIRLKVAILTSSFVKTLARHWHSREAETTRIRDSNQAPVFLDSGGLSGGDIVLLAAGCLSVLVAFQM